MNYNYLSNYGKPPESETNVSLSEEDKKRRWRSLIGVAVFLLIIGLLLWWVYFGPTPLELKARKFAVSERQFVDQNVRVDLPRGWLMLRRDNPFFPHAVSGSMYAIHPASGCTAVLLIKPNTGGPPDALIDTVKDGFVGWDKINERDRQSVTIGGQESRRATFDLWRQNAIREVAYVMTVRDDLRQYLLLGYTPLEGGGAAFNAFKELEKSLHLDPLPPPPQAPAVQQ